MIQSLFLNRLKSGVRYSNFPPLKQLLLIASSWSRFDRQSTFFFLGKEKLFNLISNLVCFIFIFLVFKIQRKTPQENLSKLLQFHLKKTLTIPIINFSYSSRTKKKISPFGSPLFWRIFHIAKRENYIKMWRRAVKISWKLNLINLTQNSIVKNFFNVVKHRQIIRALNWQ